MSATAEVQHLFVGLAVPGWSRVFFNHYNSWFFSVLFLLRDKMGRFPLGQGSFTQVPR